MKVIRFKEPYINKKTGVEIPELTIAIQSVVVSPTNTSRDKGAIITIDVALYETVADFLLLRVPCNKNAIIKDRPAKNPKVTEKKYKENKIDKIKNKDYDDYFSEEAMDDNEGDVGERVSVQALKYYREITLPKNGIQLNDTELIDVG